ncbi:MAG: hypothetical protein IKR65_01570 [Selenomonadaceae bacterium]|nr:hypothetical protein [Selenomonadaceae bacterium]
MSNFPRRYLAKKIFYIKFSIQKQLNALRLNETVLEWFIVCKKFFLHAKYQRCTYGHAIASRRRDIAADDGEMGER